MIHIYCIGNMHYLSYVGCPRCRVARVGGGDPPFARITDEGGPIGSPSPATGGWGGRCWRWGGHIP